MIAILKLIAIIRDRFPLDYSTDQDSLFGCEEFWHLASNALREWVTFFIEDPSIDFGENQGLAEYLLE